MWALKRAVCCGTGHSILRDNTSGSVIPSLVLPFSSGTYGSVIPSLVLSFSSGTSGFVVLPIVFDKEAVTNSPVTAGHKLKLLGQITTP